MKQPPLRRYTDLPSALHMLDTKKITLLNPASWDDKNDSYYIQVYKERRNLASVLALCFTQEPETYHHWKVFSGSSAGVCVEFDRAKLVHALQQQDGIKGRAVQYEKIRNMRGKKWKVSDLPFVKRHPFRDEKEFRFLYEDKEAELIAKEFDFPLDCLRKIIVSPWMPRSIFESVRRIFRKMTDCENVRVVRTTLVNNDEWKAMAIATKGK